MSLPGSPFLAYRGKELYVEDCSLNELAQRHGTPLYVYSQGAMLSALAAYERGFAGRPHLVCYAMKANSNLAVLRNTTAFNFLDRCAVSLPIHRPGEAAVGLMIVGEPMADRQLLGVAAALERALKR